LFAAVFRNECILPQDSDFCQSDFSNIFTLIFCPLQVTP
jgi:hypothetical protein